MVSALKITKDNYAKYKAFMIQNGEPYMEKSRASNTFLVVTKVGSVYKIEHYDESDFRQNFEWVSEANPQRFTEVRPIPEDEQVEKNPVPPSGDLGMV